MKVKDIDKLMEQLCFDKREAFSKHEVWLMLSEHNTKVPTVDIVPKGHWIPVSERLPDAEYGEGDSVLCCTETGLMYILYWNGGNWCVPTGEPHQWVNLKTGWHDKVIAWMPLPEPYRGEDDE